MSGQILECSARTRADVWDKLYGAEFASRLYQKLGNGFLKFHNCLRWLTIFLGGGAVVPAVIQIFSLSGEGPATYTAASLGVMGLALAIVSWLSVSEGYATKASVSMSISKSCGRVTEELSALLSEMDQYAISDSDARERLRRLSEVVRLETFGSEQVGIVIDEEGASCEEAEKESYSWMEHLKEAYGHGA